MRYLHETREISILLPRTAQLARAGVLSRLELSVGNNLVTNLVEVEELLSGTVKLYKGA